MHVDPKNAMILSFRGRLSCGFGFFCLELFILFMRTCSLSFGIIISMTFVHTFSFSILGPFLLAFCVKSRVFILFLSPVFLGSFLAFVLSHTGLALVHIQSNSCNC